MITLIFVFLYYIVWFVSVLSAAQGATWQAFLLAVAISGGQLAVARHYYSVTHLYTMVFILTLLGFIVDSALGLLGIITFAANPWPVALAPLWMIGIWLNFSIVFYCCCLPLLATRWLLLAVLSLLGFPAAYYAGVVLGAAKLTTSTGFFVIGLIWSVLLPATSYLCHRNKRLFK